MDAAEQVDYLIRIVENTRDRVLRLACQISTGAEPGHIVYAGRVLQEMRGVLARVEVQAETLAAARRAGRREGWMQGFAAATERFAATREAAPERPALRAVP